MKDNMFMAMFRKMLVENRRRILILGGGYFALCMLMGCWMGFFRMNLDAEIILYFLTAIFALTLAASITFSDLKTKQGRIAFLMQPASVCAKTLPRMIGMTAGALIAGVAGFYFMDVVRWLFEGITYSEWDGVRNPFSLIPGHEFGEAAYIFFAMYLFNISVYTLGSALAPKLSFLKTTCVMFAIQFVFVFGLSMWIKTNTIIHWDIQGNWLQYTIIGIFYAISIVLFYCAYLRIRRMTLNN